MHGGAAFVGALPAWLRAVTTGPADLAVLCVVGQASSAPCAVAGLAAARRWFDQRRALLVGGHVRIMPVDTVFVVAARRVSLRELA